MTVKGVLNGFWQFCRYLFWPQWGSKRRCAQEEYERAWEYGSVILEMKEEDIIQQEI